MQNVLETPKTGRNKLTKQNYYYSNPSCVQPISAKHLSCRTSIGFL